MAAREYEFLKPRLRLFLSVDLVGSTALKQGGSFPIKPPSSAAIDENGQEWILPLATFYKSVDYLFMRKWTTFATSALAEKFKPGSDPEFWKVNGDEILYHKEISEPQQVGICIRVWMAAIKEYRADLRNKFKKLDVKCPAWLAGFPIGNTEVVFDDSVSATEFNDARYMHYYLLDAWHSAKPGERKGFRDFIGPSIDTGFRVASLASPRKFSITADVAYLLSASTLQQQDAAKLPTQEIKIRYEGLHPLKGVLGSKPYPIFWIDFLAGEKLVVNEDSLLHGQANRYPPPHEIENFCLSFYDDNEEFILKPFIKDCTDGNFKTPPPHFDAAVDRIAELYSRDRQRIAYMKKSLEKKAARSSKNKAAEKIAALANDAMEFNVPLTKIFKPKRAQGVIKVVVLPKRPKQKNKSKRNFA